MSEHFAVMALTIPPVSRVSGENVTEPDAAPTDLSVRQRSSTSPPPIPEEPLEVDEDAGGDNWQAPVVMDGLVHQMDRQTLQAEKPDLWSRRNIAARLRMPPPLYPARIDLSGPPPGPQLEVDEEARTEPPAPLDLNRPHVASLPIALPPLSPGHDVLEPDSRLSARDIRRTRRQPSNSLNKNNGGGSSSSISNNPTNNNSGGNSAIARANLVQEMIATGTQCNVRESLPPTPTSASRPPSLPGHDADLEVLCVDLEVDEAYCRGGDDVRWLDGRSVWRRPDIPGVPGSGKEWDGIRYRLSQDAALRCQNVVRSRPRMRKRVKRPGGSRMTSRTMSIASAASTDTNSNAPNHVDGQTLASVLNSLKASNSLNVS